MMGYFGWFPDYSVKVDDILSEGSVVGLFGTAQGTCSVNGEFCFQEITGKFQRRGRL
jgi:hypothetical protein